MTLTEKTNKYYTLEGEIHQELDTKENSGTDCTCKNQQPFTYVFLGNEPTLISRCLNCGGVIT